MRGRRAVRKEQKCDFEGVMGSGQGLVWRGRVSVLSGAAGEGWGQLRAGKALSESEAQAAGGEGGCVIAARSEAERHRVTGVTGGTAVTCLLQETYRRISRVDLRFPDDVQISKLGRLFIQQVGTREGPSRRSGGRGRGGRGDSGGLGRRGGRVSRSFRGGQQGGCRGGSRGGCRQPAGGAARAIRGGWRRGQQGKHRGPARGGVGGRGAVSRRWKKSLGCRSPCLPPASHPSRTAEPFLHCCTHSPDTSPLPPPSHLSCSFTHLTHRPLPACPHPSCTLTQLLVKEPAERLPLSEVERHPWIRRNADPDVLAHRPGHALHAETEAAEAGFET